MVVKKVLIVCASGYGSTFEVALNMAEVLRARHFEVEVLPADTARAPGFDEAVIIGSAIRYDKWLPAARDYVNKHLDVLAKAQVAYFYCCLKLTAAPSADTDEEQAFDAALLQSNPRIKPIMVGGFAGTLNFQVMPWYFRLLMGLIARKQGVKEGDYRDWPVIKAWANQFADRC